ncbi:MAG TPA: anthranilate synthase component I, partial [Candidatus Nitrosotalea sp.]|nr:anthranilate synthase component I [Candidatus Nitrosotalea sp.]
MVRIEWVAWVATFGHSNLKIVPLDYSGSQFDLYNKVSRDFDYSFLFESLTGPEELAETSIMGFGPTLVIKGFSDKITLHHKNGTTTTIKTEDPLSEIKKFIHQVSDQKYRYVGGAVGIINYDAIRLWEKIPESHNGDNIPLMEFGVYDDGILYDNKEKKSFYFYHDTNRIQ